LELERSHLVGSELDGGRITLFEFLVDTELLELEAVIAVERRDNQPDVLAFLHSVEENLKDALALVARPPISVTLREAVGRICYADSENSRIAQVRFAP
jgi:hypothetical protein